VTPAQDPKAPTFTIATRPSPLEPGEPLGIGPGPTICST
jgi:hypothetical protein